MRINNKTYIGSNIIFIIKFHQKVIKNLFIILLMIQQPE